MDDILESALLGVSVDGKIPCKAALAIASELDISPKDVGGMLDRLGIRIVSCQLGCFK